MLVLLVALTFCISGCAGTIIGVRAAIAPPPIQVETYGPVPGPGFTWIGGYWTWGGNSYSWSPGHWEHIPPGRYRWENGRWIHRGRGYYWRDGRWR